MEEERPSDHARKSRQKGLLIARLVEGLHAESFQKRPYFPDLLHQPDLLIVPEPGKLSAVFLYVFGKRISWTPVLAALEDLFEVKLHLGTHTIAFGIMLTELANGRTDEDRIHLLRNTFDRFLELDLWQTELQGNRFAALISQSQPRTNLFDLWAREKGQNQLTLAHFNEEKYQHLVDKNRAPEGAAGRIEESIARRVQEILRVPIVREPLVQNIKGFLGGLPNPYRFEFDIGIVDRPDIAIDVIRTGRYAPRETLRYLMTKARLLRYVVDNGQLWLRPQPFRLVLIVEGNLAGPDHDPFRYVRALLSVGWELLRTDQLEELPRILSHADL